MVLQALHFLDVLQEGIYVDSVFGYDGIFGEGLVKELFSVFDYGFSLSLITQSGRCAYATERSDGGI